MGRPKKYDSYDIYAPQRAYFKTAKGKAAVKRYNSTESAKKIKREWDRKNRSAIVDKQQWFIDTYGDIESALAILNPLERVSISFYYGLSGDKPLTQVAIGEKLGKSHATISLINKAAIEKLNAFKQSVNSSEESLSDSLY